MSHVTRLTDIFQSKAQVKLVQHLLENPGKVFNQSTLAGFLEISASTVARIIEPLAQHGLVLFDRYERGMKILALNQDSQKTRLLMEFYEKLRAL
jgi:DNA-binding MarR family transcriptional regulator